jgi:hypothetical protein
VIILIINQHRVFALKLKSQSPVATDVDGSMLGERAPKTMQFPSWGIHIRGRLCAIQSEQLQPQFLRVLGLDSGLRSGAKESLDSAMPEGPYHVYSVTLRDSLSQIGGKVSFSTHSLHAVTPGDVTNFALQSGFYPCRNWRSAASLASVPVSFRFSVPFHNKNPSSTVSAQGNANFYLSAG